MTNKTPKEYELTYAGKRREEDIIAGMMSIPFQPVKKFGNVEEDKWDNKLIFGDNLQALKHLLKLKEEGKLRNPDGKDGVKLVYIDPPFASKQEFKGSKGQKAYQDKIAGSEFLEFLRKRLIILRELLTNDGSIFVHMDYRKEHYVKILMDEIFGEKNFRNEITVKRINKNLQGQFEHFKSMNVSTDLILWYSKVASSEFNPPLEELNRTGYWHSFKQPADRPTMRYELLGVEISEGQWMWNKERAYKAVENYKEYKEKYSDKLSLEEYWEKNKDKEFIRLGKSGTPQYYLPPKKYTVCESHWDDLVAYEYKKRIFPTQKSEELLERVISMGTNPGEIVLDCFAGSGTTGAVAEKLNRKWVMIDSSKLAIYTMQKRMLNLKEEIGQKGESLEPEPFTLYNSGIYEDGEFLEKMKTKEYEKFVLELFQAEQKNHELNGLEMQGLLNSRPVLVFSRDKLLTHDFIDELHNVVEDALKDEMYIIVPQSRVRFNEDYIIRGDKKYIVLRIPYSIIEEIKDKDFERIEQPHSQEEINKTISSVGFDFIYPPKVECEYYKEEPKETLDEENLVIEIKDFEPVQITKDLVEFDDPMEEALAMVMIDKDYNDEYFEMDDYFFGDEIVKDGFKVKIPSKNMGEKIMIIHLDVLGNEKKEVKTHTDFD